ncbi:RICIN domain-containing protein [Streptomyces sp. NPDC047072]|uniref:RICIN domain-containing protein n=1 Tax=Streptomyces sp. NPDC047072 TaxID=3154809 RepID=UPI0033CECC7F
MMSEHTPQQTPHGEDVSAVHAYAGAFCGRPGTAADLAGQVLAGQQGPVERLDLLADVRRTAFGWLRDGRESLLRPGFRDWAQRAGETYGTRDTLRRAEQDSLLLRAYGELAEQPRVALWLCLAEDEPGFAAQVLGTSVEFASGLAASARSRLADTFLRLRAEHTSDARCVHYGGMLGAIARGTHRETPPDLRRHLSTCDFCTQDITLLTTLTSAPEEELRPLLIDRLLVWGGPGYRAARDPKGQEGAETAGKSTEEPPRGASRTEAEPTDSADSTDRVVPTEAPSSPPSPSVPTPNFPTPPGGFPVTPSGFPTAPGAPSPRPADPAPRRPVFAITVAVVVTAVATTVALHLLTGTRQSGEAVNAYGPPPSRPPTGPSASASASPGTGAVLATVELKSASVTGSCVTGGADRTQDTAPAPAPCDGSDRQRWKVVGLGSGAVNLQHVASEFCLDIAGYRAPGDPMQLRPCAYLQGADAPYPEDQAFLLKTHQDRTFSLVCQDNPGISVGISNGELRMLSTTPARQATRFALDDSLTTAVTTD